MNEVNSDECEYYSDRSCMAAPEIDYTGAFAGFYKCESYPNCYYRRYKRMKNKLKSLNSKLAELDKHCNIDDPSFSKLLNDVNKIIEE